MGAGTPMSASENPWRHRRVLAYAHQGGAREAPSSTLYAIERALEIGADAIELDVHATADGELVVCHDATLDATTNGAGPIAELRYRDIARLDAAWNFVPGLGAVPGRPEADYPLRGAASSDERLRIARLADVLAATRGIPVNIDIKQTAPTVRPYEEALINLLRTAGRIDDTIVASFHEEAIERVRTLEPDVAVSPQRRALVAFTVAARTRRRPPAWLSRYAALQVPSHVRGVRLVNRAFVRAAHRASLAVHVWTINDAREMERLLAAGVDGIMTDEPSVLVSCYERLAVPRARSARPSAPSS